MVQSEGTSILYHHHGRRPNLECKKAGSSSPCFTIPPLSPALPYHTPYSPAIPHHTAPPMPPHHTTRPCPQSPLHDLRIRHWKHRTDVAPVNSTVGALYTVQCVVSSVQCTVCSVQWAVYSGQCTVANCTVCSVQCAVYSVQLTVAVYTALFDIYYVK